MDSLSLDSRYFQEIPSLEHLKFAIEDVQSTSAEIESAIKYLIVAIAQHLDVSSLYPSVAKQISLSNPEIKPLVHLYLAYYSQLEPDASLLTISTLRRELTSTNKLTRFQALRTISSMCVKIIVPLVVMAIKDASIDTSPLIRQTVLHAIIKIVKLDPSQLEVMLDTIKTLLYDISPMVVATAIAIFNELCPDRWEFIHPIFYNILYSLKHFDIWYQWHAIQLITRYVRTHFPNPEGGDALTIGQSQNHNHMDRMIASSIAQPHQDVDSLNVSHQPNIDPSEASLKDGHITKSNLLGITTTPESQPTHSSSLVHQDLDPEIQRVLNFTQPLLYSSNTSVVLAVANLYYYISPQNVFNASIIPKVLILRMKHSVEVVEIVLENIFKFSKTNSDAFRPYLSEFFLEFNDPPSIIKLKIDLLTLVANRDTIHQILTELKSYVLKDDLFVAKTAIQAFGRIAMEMQEISETCLHFLNSLISETDESISSEAIVLIIQLFKILKNAKKVSSAELETIDDHQLRDTKTSESINYEYIIVMIIKCFYLDLSTQARCSIIKFISDNLESLGKTYAPDVLRILAKSFISEPIEIKHHTLILGVKLYLSNSKDSSLLFHYILDLCKNSQSYDLRDRARMISRILTDQTLSEQQINQLFFTVKPIANPGSLVFDKKGIRQDPISVQSSSNILLPWAETKNQSASNIRQTSLSNLLSEQRGANNIKCQSTHSASRFTGQVDKITSVQKTYANRNELGFNLIPSSTVNPSASTLALKSPLSSATSIESFWKDVIGDHLDHKNTTRDDLNVSLNQSIDVVFQKSLSDDEDSFTDEYELVSNSPSSNNSSELDYSLIISPSNQTSYSNSSDDFSH